MNETEIIIVKSCVVMFKLAIFNIKKYRLLFLFLGSLFVRGEERVRDIVIYGGTSAGITAAVQAKKMGNSVVVVSPDIHLGGLSSSGLGWTDSG